MKDCDRLFYLINGETRSFPSIIEIMYLASKIFKINIIYIYICVCVCMRVYACVYIYLCYYIYERK